MLHWVMDLISVCSGQQMPLIEKVPQAGVDGGGHECAGSIKYIEGLGQEVLYKVVEEIQSLSKK